jgi:hypothetical protein
VNTSGYGEISTGPRSLVVERQGLAAADLTGVSANGRGTQRIVGDPDTE